MNITKSPIKGLRYVEDMDTGERVGTICASAYGGVKWTTEMSFGLARDDADALNEMKQSILEHRQCRAIDAARSAEVNALPEPLRTLRIERDAAFDRREIERTRVMRREDDLVCAERAYRNAEMAYAAAERRLVEAA